MNNPMLERIVERLTTATAYEKLDRHWSARAERAIYQIGVLVERSAGDRVASAYASATEPVVRWLARCQSRFLLSHL